MGRLIVKLIFGFATVGSLCGYTIIVAQSCASGPSRREAADFCAHYHSDCARCIVKQKGPNNFMPFLDESGCSSQGMDFKLSKGDK